MYYISKVDKILLINVFCLLVGLFCGEKKEKYLEFHSVVHILDGLEGKE